MTYNVFGGRNLAQTINPLNFVSYFSSFSTFVCVKICLQTFQFQYIFQGCYVNLWMVGAIPSRVHCMCCQYIRCIKTPNNIHVWCVMQLWWNCGIDCSRDSAWRERLSQHAGCHRERVNDEERVWPRQGTDTRRHVKHGTTVQQQNCKQESSSGTNCPRTPLSSSASASQHSSQADHRSAAFYHHIAVELSVKCGLVLQRVCKLTNNVINR